MYSVQIDDSPEWKVTKGLVRTIDEQTFVKLRAYDIGLNRRVCHGVLDLPRKCYKLSLAQTEGYKTLLKLRQDAVDSEGPASGQTSARDVLSTGRPDGERKRKRGGRITAAKVQELRQQPSLIDLDLPGIDGNPPLVIQVVRPCHPGDELAVRLCPVTIEKVVLFIRAKGVSEDVLTSRRSYRDDSLPVGVWKMGNAGLVRRLKADDEQEVEGSSQKYKSVKMELLSSPEASPSSSPLPIDDSEAAPLDDDHSPVRQLNLHRAAEDG